MSVTIQINSVAALQQLLGNDHEMLLELRQSAVAELMKRNVQGEVEKMVSASMTNLVNDTFTGRYWAKSEAKTQIESFVRTEVQNKLSAIVSEQLSSNLMIGQLNSQIQAAMKNIAQQVTGEGMDKIIRDATEKIVSLKFNR